MTLRILALVPYPLARAPGQRYRIEQWAPLFRADGVEIHFAPFLRPRDLTVLYEPGHTLAKALATLRGYASRVSLLLRTSPVDAVYVYREAALLGTAWLERRISKRLPLVFDFDDAIYLPTSAEANRPFAGLKSSKKTPTICGLARHVTVGNEALAAYARRHASAVTVIPSTIDTDEYRIAERAANVRPVVGWTGSTTTVRYLEALAPALRDLRGRLDFVLQVVGSEARLPGVEVGNVPWRAETEAEDLRPLDVGLMPLEDDDWSRGKCGLKALQYMALGIPPVVSPVGVNATIVRDGENGFHARNDAEWVDRIERLLRDPELRARLGAAARRTVEESYSARVQAPRMAEVFRKVVASARPD